ncbi:hypothetical protein [Kocuria marina]|uniref:hypothetical protein n=1 Tax=Kocuria marina TaxID=223184 RepID=UPI0022DEF501|nr:hypothetical protein [Kocuria marina]
MRRIGLPEIWDAREADRGFMASLATFSFVALGLELVVSGTILTLTGSVSTFYPLGWQVVEWVGLGALWVLLARALVAWSRRRGVDPLPSEDTGAGRDDAVDGRDDAAAGGFTANRTDTGRGAAGRDAAGRDDAAAGRTGVDGGVDHRRWREILLCFVLAVVLAIVLPALIGAPWGLAPLDRYLQLFTVYGPLGWLAMVAWVCYHVGRCFLIAGLLAYSHRAVREVLTFRGSEWIPWGGIVAGLVMGAVAFLANGQAAALSTLLCCVLLGLIHVRSGESLRVTTLFTVLVLIFV